MSDYYVFDSNLPIETEIRRYINSCFDRALNNVNKFTEPNVDIQTTVHDFRVSCKELRGLLRLLRGCLDGNFKALDKYIRDAAAEFAELRDNYVMQNTLNSVQNQIKGQKISKAANVQEKLVERQSDHQMLALKEKELLERVNKQLLKVREDIKAVHLSDGYSLLEQGIYKIYKKGYKCLQRVIERPSDDHFHQWRKHVKYLWFQLRLFEQCERNNLAPLVSALHDLADDLGELHDLVVLKATLKKEKHRECWLEDQNAILDNTLLLQNSLREKCLQLGAEIFASSPSDFMSKLANNWRQTKKC